MMIAFITFKSSLIPLFEGLWSSNSWEFELSGFRRNRTDDLGIDSPSLWPTEPRLHVRFLIHELIHQLIHWLINALKEEDSELWFVENKLHTALKGQSTHED